MSNHLITGEKSLFIYQKNAYSNKKEPFKCEYYILNYSWVTKTFITETTESKLLL